MNRILLGAFAVLILCLSQISTNAVAADEAPSNATTTPEPVTEKPIECSRRETPTNCVVCQETCTRPFVGNCQGLCEQGCKCRLGLFRNSEGYCVTIIGCLLDMIQTGNL